MVGVCDSKSLVASMDVLKEELNDELLSEVCHIKSAGCSLLKLGASGSGNSLAYIIGLLMSLFMDLKPNDHSFFIPEKGGYQVFSDSELRRETEEIAKLLGKSTGLYQT